MRHLRIDGSSPYRRLVGVGGVGAGIFFRLDGDQILGRNESRLGQLLDVRDYCKLHIVIHYVARLLGAGTENDSFRVIPLAKVGADPSGQRLIREMRDVGMDTSHVQSVTAPTLFSVCFQYPDGSGGNITTSNSAAALLNDGDIDSIAGLLRAGGKQTIALAVPEVPLGVRKHFLETATRCGAFRAASFAAAEVRAALESEMFKLLDLVSLNENEGEEFVGRAFSPDSPDQFVQQCRKLLRNSYPDLGVIVSAGKLGAYGITAQASAFCPPVNVNVSSTAGAGDSLLGGVLAAIATGIPFIGPTSETTASRQVDSALELGVLLSSYKCRSPHTIHPEASLDELIAFAARQGISFGPALQKRFTETALLHPAG